MPKTSGYVLFPNHENGLMLYNVLKKDGIKTTIVLTPRKTQKCCGIFLLVNETRLEDIRACSSRKRVEILRIISLEDDRDAARDVYSCRADGKCQYGSFRFTKQKKRKRSYEK